LGGKRKFAPGFLRELSGCSCVAGGCSAKASVIFQVFKVIFILEPSEQAKAAIGKLVTVVDYPDGRLAIRHKGVELAYRTFDRLRQVDQGAHR
jgi:hypothetical protein